MATVFLLLRLKPAELSAESMVGQIKNDNCVQQPADNKPRVGKKFSRGDLQSFLKLFSVLNPRNTAVL